MGGRDGRERTVWRGWGSRVVCSVGRRRWRRTGPQLNFLWKGLVAAAMATCCHKRRRGSQDKRLFFLKVPPSFRIPASGTRRPCHPHADGGACGDGGVRKPPSAERASVTRQRCTVGATAAAFALPVGGRHCLYGRALPPRHRGCRQRGSTVAPRYSLSWRSYGASSAESGVAATLSPPPEKQSFAIRFRERIQDSQAPPAPRAVHRSAVASQ